MLTLCERTVSASDDVDFHTLSRFFCKHKNYQLNYNVGARRVDLVALGISAE